MGFLAPRKGGGDLTPVIALSVFFGGGVGVCLLAQLCPILYNPMVIAPCIAGCSWPGSSVHGDSSGKNTGVGCHALLPEDLPNPGIEPRSPTLQADSLPSEPPGKPFWGGGGGSDCFVLKDK